jgi:hypothetical protein
MKREINPRLSYKRYIIQVFVRAKIVQVHVLLIKYCIKIQYCGGYHEPNQFLRSFRSSKYKWWKYYGPY